MHLTLVHYGRGESPLSPCVCWSQGSVTAGTHCPHGAGGGRGVRQPLTAQVSITLLEGRADRSSISPIHRSLSVSLWPAHKPSVSAPPWWSQDLSCRGTQLYLAFRVRLRDLWFPSSHPSGRRNTESCCLCIFPLKAFLQC